MKIKIKSKSTDKDEHEVKVSIKTEANARITTRRLAIVVMCGVLAVASVVMLVGCGADEPVRKPTAPPSAPVTDTPPPQVDLSDGVDEAEAKVIALDEARSRSEGGRIEVSSVSKDDGDWVVVCSQRYPEGTTGIPYSVTVTVDGQTGTVVDSQEAF